MSFFDKLRVFHESAFDRIKIVNLITEEIQFEGQYFIMLILSIVIATFGLIMNNGAVIIGSMILAPMLWPIIGISLSNVTRNRKMFADSLYLLGFSIILMIVISTIIAYISFTISPIFEINREIAVRINPTIFDLFVALAAGFAAPIIISWTRFTNAAAGVAVAASLLPPGTTIGIGITLGNFNIAYGSFILFFTNLASIIFAGIIVFAIIGFYKKNDEAQAKSVEVGLLLSSLIIVVLSAQLFISLKQIIEDNTIKTTVKNILTEELQAIATDTKVDSILITHPVQPEDPFTIESVVKTPADFAINLEQKNQIVHLLEDKLHDDINLEIRLIPALTVLSKATEKQQELDALKGTVESFISEYFHTISDAIQLDNLKVGLRTEAGREVKIAVTLKIPKEIEITDLDREDLASKLSTHLNAGVEIDVSTITFSKVRKEREVDGHTQMALDLKHKIEEYVAAKKESIPADISKIDVTHNAETSLFDIVLEIQVPEEREVPENYILDLKAALSDTTEKESVIRDDLNITFKVFKYQKG